MHTPGHGIAAPDAIRREAWHTRASDDALVQFASLIVWILIVAGIVADKGRPAGSSGVGDPAHGLTARWRGT